MGSEGERERDVTHLQAGVRGEGDAVRRQHLQVLMADPRHLRTERREGEQNVVIRLALPTLQGKKQEKKTDTFLLHKQEKLLMMFRCRYCDVFHNV